MVPLSLKYLRIKNPLGKFYMYFAHHSGSFIRLAYSDSIDGTWAIYESGSLHLEQATIFYGHIASPDVHVDNDSKEIRMYFHGHVKGRQGQWTGTATSSDGINFQAAKDILGKFYFRVWQWKDSYYALAKNNNEGWGELYRSDDGLTNFVSRGNFLPNMRHGSVFVHGYYLLIFYSCVGDSPERVVCSTVDMRSNWHSWIASKKLEVLRPETNYEGIQYPILASTHGSAINVNQLRDPFVFYEDIEEKFFLFYTVAAEMGIALAQIKWRIK